MTPRDVAALIALAALWGSSFFFIRIAVPELGPTTLVVARVAIGGTLLWAIAAATRKRIELRTHARPLLVVGLINAALPFVLISAAELHLTASFAALLNATAPLFAALFSMLWLGERFTAARAAGLVLGVGGVAIMVGWSPLPLELPTLLGIAGMLVASASYAGSAVYIRRRLRGVPTHTLALGQQLAALAWLAIPAVIWAPRSAPSPVAIGAVVALGVLSTAVAYLLYFRLIERVGPTKTSTVTYLLPVFGVLWGALFLGERVTGGMVAGFVVILMSLGLVNEVRLTPLAARRPA